MNILPWNRPRDAQSDDRAHLDTVYPDDRRQERAKIADRRHVDAEKRRAYERGRRDERARRRRSPLLTFSLLVAAAIGCATVWLAVREGSFAGGGQLVDQNVANARSSAAQAGQAAASRAGDALQAAGSQLKSPGTNQAAPGQS